MNAEHNQERSQRKIRVGTVVSAAMNKSIVVRIETDEGLLQNVRAR
jgi:ribosomal protein S17